MTKPNSTTPLSWKAEKINATTHIIRFDNISAGWNQKILLTADRHHDNLHTDHRLELEHLEEAKEAGAPIIDIGDLFCAMQGRYDPRKSYTNMRPEYIGDDYFDRLLDCAHSFYGPYADLFAVIGKGNHEKSILKRQQLDLIKGLSRRLGNVDKMGAYAGWVLLQFKMNKTRYQTIRIKYHHGYGGGGPVTKGVIQANRRAVYLPDADIVMTGHIHEAWVMPFMRERINTAGNVSIEKQWHVSVPTYKEEYLAGDGWHIETGKPPKPVGCAWLDLSWDKARIKSSVRLDI